MSGNERYNRKLMLDALPRAQRAERMRLAGKTWAEIGKELGGVSRQFAQRLVARLEQRRNGRAAK